MKLNIYEFDWTDEKDWVIASSKKKAIEIHMGTTDLCIDEYDCIIKLVKKKNWKNYNFWAETPDKTITFKEYMETMNPDEDFFCSTAY